jgi:hypothetical protein
MKRSGRNIKAPVQLIAEDDEPVKEVAKPVNYKKVKQN